MAHNDLLAPEFLAATVSVLDKDDSIVICYTQELTVDVRQKQRKIYIPTWRQSYEYFRSVNRFALPSKNKAECYSELLDWMIFPRTKVDLVKDIRLVTKKLLLRSRYGERIYRMLRHNGNSMLSFVLGSLWVSAVIFNCMG